MQLPRMCVRRCTEVGYQETGKARSAPCMCKRTRARSQGRERWGGAVAVAHDAMRRSREGTQPSICASRGRNTALLPLWQGVVL